MAFFTLNKITKKAYKYFHKYLLLYAIDFYLRQCFLLPNSFPLCHLSLKRKKEKRKNKKEGEKGCVSIVAYRSADDEGKNKKEVQWTSKTTGKKGKKEKL